MNIKCLFVIIILHLLFTISCKESNSTSIIQPKKEYYRIKLNQSQIREVGSKRFLILTKEQFRYLKNKISKFHVGGPNYFTPEGWFCANWIKPDEVIIEKYLIDNFENLIDDSKFDKSDFELKSIVVNIDINGFFYYKNQLISLDKLLSNIKELSEKHKPNYIGVYISYAPIENNEIQQEVLKKVNIIREYTKLKKIHFQDDW